MGEQEYSVLSGDITYRYSFKYYVGADCDLDAVGNSKYIVIKRVDKFYFQKHEFEALRDIIIGMGYTLGNTDKTDNYLGGSMCVFLNVDSGVYRSFKTLSTFQRCFDKFIADKGITDIRGKTIHIVNYNDFMVYNMESW